MRVWRYEYIRIFTVFAVKEMVIICQTTSVFGHDVNINRFMQNLKNVDENLSMYYFFIN